MVLKIAKIIACICEQYIFTKHYGHVSELGLKICCLSVNLLYVYVETYSVAYGLIIGVILFGKYATLFVLQLLYLKSFPVISS